MHQTLPLLRILNVHTSTTLYDVPSFNGSHRLGRSHRSQDSNILAPRRRCGGNVGHRVILRDPDGVDGQCHRAAVRGDGGGPAISMHQITRHAARVCRNVGNQGSVIRYLWDDGLAEETTTRAKSDMYAARFRRQPKNSWLVSRLNLDVDIDAATDG